MRYILVKCPFEKLLEVAEKLEHKMPIFENDFDIGVSSQNNLLEENYLKKSLSCFKRLIRLNNKPEEIKRYYYHAPIQDNDLMNDADDDLDRNDRKFFTAPYESHIRDKYVFNLFIKFFCSLLLEKKGPKVFFTNLSCVQCSCGCLGHWRFYVF